ncbi:hypothetical protein BDY21DRAFT_382064 [Lineolata rhizophorae]|uniref:Iron-sulfur cluster assembly factor IBA57 homolog, mitochondrial n=1 Tax=Lineolata rhizophorae TaxID=578093 RepID=A0A6A6NQH0_9PEZI|nr:hypothetical protein BDY21DRAFT_382064 [Lineolata rhizophorae]
MDTTDSPASQATPASHKRPHAETLTPPPHPLLRPAHERRNTRPRLAPSADAASDKDNSSAESVRSVSEASALFSTEVEEDEEAQGQSSEGSEEQEDENDGDMEESKGGLGGGEGDASSASSTDPSSETSLSETSEDERDSPDQEAEDDSPNEDFGIDNYGDDDMVDEDGAHPLPLSERIARFLPQLRAANEALERDMAEGRQAQMDMENVGVNEAYVEMSLGLGVLEERKRNGVGQDEMEESSSEESEDNNEADDEAEFGGSEKAGASVLLTTSPVRLSSATPTSSTPSTSALSLSPAPAPPSPKLTGLARLSERSLLTIYGRDAAHFLQGLVTNAILAPNPPNIITTSETVASAPDGAGDNGGALGKAGEDVLATLAPTLYTAFLNAPGRIVHDAFVYGCGGVAAWRAWASARESGKREKDRVWAAEAEDPAYLVEVDAAQRDTLLKHLRRHKLRSKIDFAALSAEEWGVWAAWDARAAREGEEGLLAALRRQSRAPASSILLQRDPRAPGLGARIVAPVAEAQTLLSDATAVAAGGGPTDYALWRYLHGVPEGAAELVPESALPHESNMDVMHGVDFRKGCYVGQELTIRTQHTGVVRKRVLPVLLYAGGDDGAVAKSEAGSSDATLTTPAMLRPELYAPELEGLPSPAPGVDIKPAGRSGRSAGNEGGNYKPGMEFKLKWKDEGGKDMPQEDGQGVFIKAIVPPWLREKIEISPEARKRTE